MHHYDSYTWKDLWHGQWWLCFKWRALPSVEDDGGEQSKRHPVTADSGQDHPPVWQGEKGHDDFYVLNRPFLQDNDGKINFDEFCQVVKNTDIHTRMVVEV